MENTNPIICDPESKEALDLLGKECEFANRYKDFQEGKAIKAILQKIYNESSAPFSEICSGHTHSYFFIRKSLEKKLSEKIIQLLNTWDNKYATPHISSHDGLLSMTLSILNEAVHKLEELGE